MAQVQYYGEYNTRKGLQNLKSAFLLYMIGGILAFVPAVSTVGVVIDFVALIFLIISWRELGKSSLKESQRYAAAGKWLVWAIIIAIVLAVAAYIVVFGIAFSSLISQLDHSPTGNLSSFNSNVAMRFGLGLAGDIIVVDLLVYIIWLAAWFKMCYSIKALALDIAQPKLISVGNLYMIESVLGYANLIPIALSFLTGMNFGATPTPPSLILLAPTMICSWEDTS